MKISRRERIGVLAAAVLALFVISLPGTASAKDRNKDRIPDRWERSHSLSLKRDQRKLDQDSDGLRNRGEWLSGTNPRDKDSDDDGVTDAKEKAGVISSWNADTGELTLTLYAGGELTGSVTDETRVQCEDAADDSAGTDDDGTPDQGSGDAENFHGGPGSGHGSEDESGDDSGSQSSDDQSGDDQSGDDAREDEGNRGPGGDGRGKGGCDGNCSVADLATGVEVTEAVVKYTASGKVFKELEIVAPADE